MKKLRVAKGKVAQVFKRKSYVKTLTEGIYWLKFNEEAVIYDLAKEFIPIVELNVLLKDESLKSMLDVYFIKENEIGLLYEDQIFKGILESGKYAFWKGVIEFKVEKINLNSLHEIDKKIQKLIHLPQLVKFVRTYPVESYEKAILTIDGKYEKTLSAGLYCFWKNNTAISVLKADLRKQQMEISGQEILTKDKAALRLNFFAQYKITDIEKALLSNKAYDKQMYLILQLALREYIGTYSFDELLENKESISPKIIEKVSSSLNDLGLEIINCGVRDIILPGEMKDIMNQVLVAQKKAQANIITRREETASTRSLLNTAKLMEENKMLFKLKEMEYVEKIAEKINNISISGGNQLVEQMKGIFSPNA